MQYKTLGNTGLLVSQICLGTMTFAGDDPNALSENGAIWKAIGNVNQADADALIKASFDAGVNFIDTADVYSEGKSEITLGRSLKNLNIARKDVVIATKVYGRTGPGRNDVGASRGHIWMPSKPASAASRPTTSTSTRSTATTPSPPSKRPSALWIRLSHQGKVRYIGVSNWHAWKIAKALGISEFKNLARFDTLQAYYSIAGRDLERDIVPLLEAEKTGLLVWSPLAGGLFPANSPAKTRNPPTPAAPPSTSPSSTRSASGTSWTFSSPSPALTTYRPPPSPSPTFSPSPSSPPSSSEPSASTSSTRISPPSTSNSPPRN